MEVTLEADIQAPAAEIFEAPFILAQFAVTYLRTHFNLQVEIPAGVSTGSERVEWLVDGRWLSHAQAEPVDRSRLTHFRLRRVNAVVMHLRGGDLPAGVIFEATVPQNPHLLMQEVADGCADANPQVPLDPSVYWYHWNPHRPGCPGRLLQIMTLTVERQPADSQSYPEYDRLWEDGMLTVAVFWARLDDSDIRADSKWINFDLLGAWLREAGFEEWPAAPTGSRFVRRTGDLSVIVDVYGPDAFHSVADFARLKNWEKAISEHEVVFYNGHDVLDTGMAFEEVRYPSFYQIFQVSSFGYDTYLRPVLTGKGTWDKFDLISNVQPAGRGENLLLCGAILSRLIYGFEHAGKSSWQDIMEAASTAIGYARFGVHGARTNCFTPQGDICSSNIPDPGEERRYENYNTTRIPDNESEGLVSSIEITDDYSIFQLAVEIDIHHSYVGDLLITLDHDGTSIILWDHQGASNTSIRQSFDAPGLAEGNVRGIWTLTVVDSAAADQGTLIGWALKITKAI